MGYPSGSAFFSVCGNNNGNHAFVTNRTGICSIAFQDGKANFNLRKSCDKDHTDINQKLRFVHQRIQASKKD
jgi:hypothetical protein